MARVLEYFILLSLFVCFSTEIWIDEIRECNITTNILPSTKRPYFNIRDFCNNNPKPNEIFRAVSWFSWKYFVFGIRNKKSTGYYFEHLKDQEYAIFRNHSDWYEHKEPCDIQSISPNDGFIKIETVLAIGKLKNILNVYI